jgi:molybdopterin converting factor small subunit
MKQENNVIVHIPSYYEHITNDQAEVTVHGNNVRECLDDLIRQFPEIKNHLFDKKKGILQNIIEIYINQKSAYPGELAKPVNDGDEIHIIVMSAGG